MRAHGSMGFVRPATTLTIVILLLLLAAAGVVFTIQLLGA